jgi:hypothetical protein
MADMGLLTEMRFAHHPINKKIQMIDAKSGVHDVEQTKRSLL